MNKKIMATFAIMMFALSIAGFAYAHWTDVIYIEGTVEMGELLVGWYDTTPYLLTWTETTNGGTEQKPWVCDAVITLDTPETSVHHVPPETVYKYMRITVDNAYPQWDCHIQAWLKNAGTIPAKVNPDFSISMWDQKDNEPLEFRLDSYYWDGIGWHIEGAVVDNGDDNIFGTADDVDIINFLMFFDVPYDWQIEPCTAWSVWIGIDFKQEAEECHTYTFLIDIESIQWNKATW